MLFTSNLLPSAMSKYVKGYLTIDRNYAFMSDVKSILGQYASSLVRSMMRL